MFEPFSRSGHRETDDRSFLDALSLLVDPVQGSVMLRYTGLANTASLLYWYLPDVNWVGFYLRDFEIPALLYAADMDYAPSEPRLRLGPFQGLPACTSIPFGSGVCGTAAAFATTQLVPDVHAFSGHIACDGASRSELVVPVFKNGIRTSSADDVMAVIDLDSPMVGRFTEADATLVESVANLVGERLF